MADVDLRLRGDLGVWLGESDLARMLCQMLVLLAAAAPMVKVALPWWLGVNHVWAVRP